MSDANIFSVDQPMTFQTVPDLLARSSQWLQASSGPVVFDLQQAQRADSAGIALLVEWVELARTQQREISIINLPEQIEDLVNLNDLMPLLQQHTAN